MKAKISGSGIFLPEFIVTNEKLASIYPVGPAPEWHQNFNWNAQWIERKLGIKERRFAFDLDSGIMRPGFYDLDMAEIASGAAMQNANMQIGKIDLIIHLTTTPEYYIPDQGVFLSHRLGAKEVPAFALNGVGCGGFIYGMIIAQAFIGSGIAKTVLLSSATSVSSYMVCHYEPGITEERKKSLRQRDRINASIFGDGAGAMILTASESDKGLADFFWGSSAIDNPVIMEAGGSKRPATIETVLAGLHYFNMNTGLVKLNGPRLFEKTVKSLLAKSGVAISDIDYFVFHQVNMRLLQHISRELEIPWEKMAVHVAQYGNLDTATLAVGYHEAKISGKIKDGDLVLFAAIGAGWQFGSALVRV